MCPGVGMALARCGALLRGWRRKVLAVVTIAFMLFGIATAVLLVWPPESLPTRADAIVMLAGPGDRLPVALRLAREHKAPLLVVSRGWQGYGGPCPPPVSGVRMICFDPDPGNTRGEAEFIGRIAKRYGWHAVILVTTRPQAVRAELIVGRCFAGQVSVATAPIPVGSWPYQIAYGWGALFKAVFLVRSC
jgi:hypothetical protein